MGIDRTRSFEELKLREQEVRIEKKREESLVDEGQWLHRRTELEHRQEQLCALLNTTPREFEDTPMSLVERNTKLQNYIQMLNDLQEHRLGPIASYYSVLKEQAERLYWTWLVNFWEVLLLLTRKKVYVPLFGGNTADRLTRDRKIVALDCFPDQQHGDDQIDRYINSPGPWIDWYLLLGRCHPRHQASESLADSNRLQYRGSPMHQESADAGLAIQLDLILYVPFQRR